MDVFHSLCVYDLLSMAVPEVTGFDNRVEFPSNGISRMLLQRLHFNSTPALRNLATRWPQWHRASWLSNELSIGIINTEIENKY
jgi:hypothetical protein